MVRLLQQQAFLSWRNRFKSYLQKALPVLGKAFFIAIINALVILPYHKLYFSGKLVQSFFRHLPFIDNHFFNRAVIS